MSSQIVFQSDLLNQSYFALGGDIQNITLNATQWMQLRQDISHQMSMYMAIALLIGAVIGIYVGWSWKTYYLNKEEVSDGSGQK